jgi:predicted lipoprotein with Yx(FWY)xxD motif
MLKTLVLGLMISTATAAAMAATTATLEPAVMGDTSMGKAWVDTKGMTLYTFEKDAAGKSSCNDDCAVEWPPLAAASDSKPAGDWTIVTRDDGSKMRAYEGHPLYTFVDDKKAGDATGDKKDGFHLATQSERGFKRQLEPGQITNLSRTFSKPNRGPRRPPVIVRTV